MTESPVACEAPSTSYHAFPRRLVRHPADAAADGVEISVILPPALLEANLLAQPIEPIGHRLLSEVVSRGIPQKRFGLRRGGV